MRLRTSSFSQLGRLFPRMRGLQIKRLIGGSRLRGSNCRSPRSSGLPNKGSTTRRRWRIVDRVEISMSTAPCSNASAANPTASLSYQSMPDEPNEGRARCVISTSISVEDLPRLKLPEGLSPSRYPPGNILIGVQPPGCSWSHHASRRTISTPPIVSAAIA